MSEELTKKQKAFADNYIETGNATESVIDAGYDVKDENSAAVIGSENLRKLNIREYIEDNAIGAAARIVDISKEAKNEAVKLSANKDILDRAGYKPIEKQEHTFDLTDLIRKKIE